jgi:adenine-specific DNA-methyltransferase
MRQPTPPPSCNVYTPESLADALVAALGDTPVARWLEPCVGKGALLEAISRGGTEKQRVVGLDLAKTSEPNDQLGRVKRSTEFLDWAARTTSRFDRIVANPPYISLRRLPAEIRTAAVLHQTPAGNPVPAGSNCWYAFLCAALRLLRPGGSLGFVLPASFEYAGYAATLREELPELFGECHVHRCQVPIFDAVDEGAVVLLCRGFGEESKAVTRGQHRTLRGLVSSLTSHQTSDCVAKATVCSSLPDHVMLRDVMNVGIGAVTGDSNFFLLRESQRLLHRLPKSVLRPIVSRARHLQCPTITKDVWAGYCGDDERVWLFRPSEADLGIPEVRAYMELQPEQGGCERNAFKVRNRTPWWRTRLPPRPHGFLSGMTQHGPIVCFNEKPHLTATNTLYTVRFADRIAKEDRCAWALMLMTTSARNQIEATQRTYALGLKKLEPGDISSLRLPVPGRPVPMSAYRQAIKAVVKGDWAKACQIADCFVADTE